MKDWDFGYYGKGARGYAHYKQDFDRMHRGGGSGGGGGGWTGCLVWLIGLPLLAAALAGIGWLLDQMAALL